MPHSITFKAIQHETHFFVELTSMPIPASNVFFSTSHSSVTRVACSCGQHSTASIRRVAPKVAHSSTPSLFWLRPRRHCRCSRVEPNVAHSSIRLLEPLDPSFFAEIAGTRRSIATRMASTFLYAVTAQNDSRQCCLVIGVLVLFGGICSLVLQLQFLPPSLLSHLVVSMPARFFEISMHQCQPQQNPSKQLPAIA